MKIRILIKRFLSIYLGSIVLICIGIFSLIVPLVARLPNANDLVERRAHVDNYFIKISCDNVSCSHTYIIALKEGYRIWTAAPTIDDYSAKEFLKQGSEVRFSIWPKSDAKRIDGAIKAYGMNIDGQRFFTPEDTVIQDKLCVYLLLPAIGLFSLFISIPLYLYRRNRYNMVVSVLSKSKKGRLLISKYWLAENKTEKKVRATDKYRLN